MRPDHLSVVNVGGRSTNFYVVSRARRAFSSTSGSDDRVSLLLDNGFAFTGDLPHPSMVTDDSAAAVARSWQELRSRGVTTIYPGHGPVRPLAVYFGPQD